MFHSLSQPPCRLLVLQIAMASAWSKSAEAYIKNFQRGEENEICFDMSVGRQAVVAKVVKALADKVEQGLVK